MLTNDHIKKFQRLHQDYFGKPISRAAAIEQGTALVRMMEIIYKPMNVTEHDAMLKKREGSGVNSSNL